MLKQRVVTAVVALVLLFTALYVLPETVTRLLIAAVILTGAWEWAAFVGLSGAGARFGYVALIAVLLGIVQFLLVPALISTSTVFVAALAWWFIALLWIFRFPTAVPRPLAAAVGAIALLPAWLALDIVYRADPSWLLFMLIIVWAADVGAYFAGKQFGRVKLAPQISPGKTWEGVVGGLLLVAVFATLGAHYFGRPLAVMLPFCLAIGMISVVGDLTVSIFKRAAGIKDSGRLFPGHGGLLDRIDSVTAAAPLFALGTGWAAL
jgi:phosphatidate cytidylyltransferase